MGLLSGNCFRLHAVIYNHRIRNLYQIDFSGTLWECLAQLLSNLGEYDEPQVITIIKNYHDKCVEFAAMEELAVRGEEIESLEKVKEELEPKYCTEYLPPIVEVKYPYITIRENPRAQFPKR